ncbi:hypothetical protein EGR_05447 [Echinococcus granulosus]|uniref:Uncharacterized protein n=1 Tax=Echinococcus granulosus TaxID=6210 RepID=W6UE43_ECHGR|nr:hypothetical protein EGR_05447 [Echinococcus granulosus]EUB59685.1 hypothetical protein EGR_05447 [Echinococcus granulosus]
MGADGEYEQEVQWKSTQTENVLLTVDKGTQTVEEYEVPVYPDVTDNADATRLKEWIEELFKLKLPRKASSAPRSGDAMHAMLKLSSARHLMEWRTA